jgi:hypothetical protein
MKNIDFEYPPKTYVQITYLGLDCEGRVIRNIFNGRDLIYEVEFCINGSIHRHEFFGDELRKK